MIARWSLESRETLDALPVGIFPVGPLSQSGEGEHVTRARLKAIRLFDGP